MCLFGKARPAWEEDVTFSNRRHPRHRITETTIRSHSSRRESPRPVQFIAAPPSPPPAPRPITPIIHQPATIIVAPSPPPPAPLKVELVSVEEESVRSRTPRKSRHGSSSAGDREEVYIEREREIQRRRPSPAPPQMEQYDTYRYVPGVAPHQYDERRRSSRGDVAYDAPRVSTGRITEREHERVVVNDGGAGGRRRDYHRR